MKFEFQGPLILKIEKPIRFMFYASTSVEKKNQNFICKFVFQFIKKTK